MTIKKITLILSGMLGLLLPSSAQDQTGKHLLWRKALGSEDFKTRDTAMEEVWAAGQSALSFLEELTEDNDPEISLRAATIARMVRLGVTPDTPPKIIELVDGYFEASIKGKISVAEKLRDNKEYDILLRLLKMESNLGVVERMRALIAEIIPKIVRERLNANEIQGAKDILLMSDQFKHLIQYAHLLGETGGLDQEIARLRGSKSKTDQARYLACLRVQGDVALLREEARRLGDKDTEVLAALLDGDHIPFFESLVETGDIRLTSAHYLDWVLAGYRGDDSARDEAFDTLKYLAEEMNDKEEARICLFKMGYGQVVVDLLKPAELGIRVNYHLMQENYAKAEKLLGLPEDGNLRAWIKKTSQKAEEELEGDLTSIAGERLLMAAEFLEGRGRVAEATECAKAVFDVVRDAEDQQLENWAQGMFFSAPIATLCAVAREVDEHKAEPSVFLKTLNRYSMLADEQEWLFELLKEIFPEMDTRERILAAVSFSSRRLLIPVERYDLIRNKVFEEIKKEEEVGGLKYLLVLFQNRNREKDLLEVEKALAEADAPNSYLSAMMALDGGRMKDAAENYQKLETNLETSAASFLYQKGLVLKKAGVAEGDEMIKKARLYSDGSLEDLADFSLQHQRHGEGRKSHETLKHGLLRIKSLRSNDQFREGLVAIERLAVSSGTFGEWKEAVALREVAALKTLRSVASGVFLMRNRFQVLVAQGAYAMQKGEIEVAVRNFTKAHRLLPRDGYLANDLFPILRQFGLQELHDQLYAESANACRENIRRYPKDDNVYNNFAWLASRANRNLDEAEGYLKKALKMNPQSAAYLDTMGEIYFARQKREEAVKWSSKSLQNELFGFASGWELHQQHFRFKRDGFPVR